MRRLIIRPGAIGDCILSLPAMENLRADYTEVWVPSIVVPLIHLADQVRSIASTSLDLLGVMDPPASLLETLRSFDSIISWYGSNRAEFREAVAALPFHFLTTLPPPDSKVHATDFFLSQTFPYVVGRNAISRRTDSPLYNDYGILRSATVRERCQEDFVVIHPFSGSARKNWPLDNFRQLAAKLPWPVQWCAGPEEQLENAVRIDHLGELAEWLATARIYIGNDSGITHLAAAAGIPVVAIFVSTDPAVWAPRGPRVKIVQAGMSIDAIAQICCNL